MEDNLATGTIVVIILKNNFFNHHVPNKNKNKYKNLIEKERRPNCIEATATKQFSRQ